MTKLGRKCGICTHEERAEIDRLLVRGGTSFRDISGRFGVSTSALSRHKNDHIPAALARAHDAGEAARAGDLLDRLAELDAIADKALAEAAAASDWGTVLRGIDTARRTSELRGKLTNELREGVVTVNVVQAPQWIELRTVILEALRPHPAVLDEVVEAVARVEEGGGGDDG